MTRAHRRLFAALAAAACLAATAGCANAPADGGNDPWVSQGSVGVGPIYGNPPGPYGSRPR